MDSLISPVYRREFYLEHVQARPEYHQIAEWIDLNLGPDSVMDFGCGNAYILERLHQFDCEVAGVESAPEAFEFISENIRERVSCIDLRVDANFTKTFDLTLCIETIEHVEEQFADTVLGNIDRATNRPGKLLFSAATPAQFGFYHVNLRPREHWIEQLARIGGWKLNVDASASFAWCFADLRLLRWIPKNVMILERQ